MCGRFALTMSTEALADVFDAVAPEDPGPPMPRHNICPTQQVPVLVTHEGARQLVFMRWGFVPRWYKHPTDGPLLINARAETIADKPAFRDACRARRCILPADGFFEWASGAPKGAEPWYICPRQSNLPLFFAGIWQAWSAPNSTRLVTCAIVTTQAGPDISEIHHRMPVILDPADIPLWLGEQGKGAAPLMKPAPVGSLARHRVSTRVNSNRAEGADLIAPLEGADGAPAT